MYSFAIESVVKLEGWFWTQEQMSPPMLFWTNMIISLLKCTCRKKINIKTKPRQNALHAMSHWDGFELKLNLKQIWVKLAQSLIKTKIHYMLLENHSNLKNAGKLWNKISTYLKLNSDLDQINWVGWNMWYANLLIILNICAKSQLNSLNVLNLEL